MLYITFDARSFFKNSSSIYTVRMHEKSFKLNSFPHTRATHALVCGPGSSMPFFLCPQWPLLWDGLFLYIHSATCHTAHMSLCVALEYGLVSLGLRCFLRLAHALYCRSRQCLASVAFSV